MRLRFAAHARSVAHIAVRQREFVGGLAMQSGQISKLQIMLDYIGDMDLEGCKLVVMVCRMRQVEAA